MKLKHIELNLINICEASYTDMYVSPTVVYKLPKNNFAKFCRELQTKTGSEVISRLPCICPQRFSSMKYDLVDFKLLQWLTEG